MKDALELRGIRKSFSGVEVLHGIELSVRCGEIHALVGENGAGKSTLVKIMSGFYPHGSYEGEMCIAGEEAKFSGIKAAERAGIRLIPQEIELVGQLKVYENVFLGNERTQQGMLDTVRMIRETEEVFERFEIEIDPLLPLEKLGVGKQQLVTIARALKSNADVLIFDEPTAALTDIEAEKLFQLIGELKERQITIIYISHRLGEVMRLADRITVMRDGNIVITDDKKNMQETDLVRHMVGRELVDQYPYTHREIGAAVLSVRDVHVVNAAGKVLVNHIALDVHAGEIVGIAGLVGAGRTELVRSIFGAMPGRVSAQISIHGERKSIQSPRDAIRCGIGLVTEDRKIDGLVGCRNISENIALASLDESSYMGLMLDGEVERSARSFVSALSIRAANPKLAVERMSGGNQQKVCIAKFLKIKPAVLIMDEPTRGVDVGAKFEIYTIINELASQGVAILFVSSELSEVLGVSDRILVMKEGRISGQLKREQASQESIMQLAVL